jgi:hypothetical protein
MYLVLNTKVHTRLLVSDLFQKEIHSFIKAAIKYLENVMEMYPTLRKLNNECVQLIEILEQYRFLYRNKYSEEESKIIPITEEDCFEFWATFTSCYNLFVLYKIDGLFMFILTCKTFDENMFYLSEENCSLIFKTLINIYKFNEDELLSLCSFFQLANQYKCSIYCDKQEEAKLLTNF